MSPFAPLTQKLWGSAPRVATASDFQTPAARETVGEQILIERQRVTASMSDAQLLDVVDALPAFAWAAKSFMANELVILQPTVECIRQACQVVDASSSAENITTRINANYGAYYGTWGLRTLIEITKAPTIVANNVAESIVESGWDKITGDQSAELTSDFIGRELAVPFGAFCIEWRQPGRVEPGRPTGYLAYVEEYRRPDFAFDNYLDALKPSLQAPQFDVIDRALKVQLLADFGESQLVGPLALNYLFLDSDGAFIYSSNRPAPIATQLMMPAGEGNVKGKSFVDLMPVMLTLVCAKIDAVRTRYHPILPQTPMSMELDLRPLLTNNLSLD